ncbi:MAG TPA: CDP-diacylglycerol--serine O-phosphatidyltransferase [Deltaproteobacteria bacterium]|nr:CDP-diacylglycerol--serine O-phosphatidyltransferase [Deltaproteobacteria bacterium]
MRKRLSEKKHSEKKKRLVPFLPNFITTIGLFCGFYSISFSLKGSFIMASIFILIAGFIDGVDGRVARMTNSVSDFGKQYDSLSDVICFGVAPAIMVYLWQLNLYERFGFIACFLFVACGALRLARFNIDTTPHPTSFKGLPIPVAAGGVASMVLLTRVVGTIDAWMVLLVMYLLSFLMVSNIRYPSFKQLSFIRAHPFQLLVCGVLLLVVVALSPEIMLFVLAMTFIVGGALWDGVRYLVALRREKKEEKGATDERATGKDNHI